ncbi:MAG: leucine-rich repeat domain-containing protein [Lachnospiraceae bacterium]
MTEKQERLEIPEGIREIMPFAMAEHREIQELILPDSLKKIGAHAFYNDRSLISISFSDNLDDIGDGAFKNCEKINRLLIRKQKGNMRGLKDLLADLHQEIEVRIFDENSSEEARLIFPYYLMNYEENTPARIVNQIAEGSGVEYRNCVSSSGIDFLFYDRLFTNNQAVDLQGCSARIAMARLRFPYGLTDRAEETYRKYLTAHAQEIMKKLIAGDREQAMTDFLDLNLTDRDFLTRMIEYARVSDFSQALSALLNYERSHYGRKKKTYDFF